MSNPKDITIRKFRVNPNDSKADFKQNKSISDQIEQEVQIAEVNEIICLLFVI